MTAVDSSPKGLIYCVGTRYVLGGEVQVVSSCCRCGGGELGDKEVEFVVVGQ